MRGIFLLIFAIAAVGIALGIAAAAARRGKNVFKMQGVAWLVTLVLVAASVGIGYAKSPMAGIRETAPAPDYGDSYHWEGGQFLWDNADALSDRTLRVLDQRNERLWQRHGVSIGVVTCNYGGDDLYSFAIEQFKNMGLGGNDMIVVLDISGENYWLYTGDDVAWKFSDQDCSDYTYEYMEEWFAAGSYDEAVLSLTEALEVWYGDHYSRR